VAVFAIALVFFFTKHKKGGAKELNIVYQSGGLTSIQLNR